jgi:hypothetical protein
MIEVVSGWGGRWGANRHKNGLGPSSLGTEAIRFFTQTRDRSRLINAPIAIGRAALRPYFGAWFTESSGLNVGRLVRPTRLSDRDDKLAAHARCLFG